MIQASRIHLGKHEIDHLQVIIKLLEKSIYCLVEYESCSETTMLVTAMNQICLTRKEFAQTLSQSVIVDGSEPFEKSQKRPDSNRCAVTPHELIQRFRSIRNLDKQLRQAYQNAIPAKSSSVNSQLLHQAEQIDTQRSLMQNLARFPTICPRHLRTDSYTLTDES